MLPRSHIITYTNYNVCISDLLIAAQVNDCPGHFGHMKLARPVFHVGFIDVTLKVLRCVCFHCSRLRVDKSDFKFRNAMKIKNPKTRLNALHEICRNKDK
jgi:DNA-directed RNA polymerase II subunit RPB1